MLEGRIHLLELLFIHVTVGNKRDLEGFQSISIAEVKLYVSLLFVAEIVCLPLNLLSILNVCHFEASLERHLDEAADDSFVEELEMLVYPLL